MDEERLFEAGKYKIGTSRKIASLKPKTKAHGVRGFADGYFRLGVPLADAGH